jgi:hypothetical protein
MTLCAGLFSGNFARANHPRITATACRLEEWRGLSGSVLLPARPTQGPSERDHFGVFLRLESLAALTIEVDRR